MASTFPNLSFGPMHLRPVLRRRLERHEHLIAWGLATSGDQAQLLHLTMAMVPGVGPAFAAMMASSGRRLVVITSRRVIVLLNRKPGVLRRDKAVCFEARHEYLGVARAGRRKEAKFVLTAHGLDFPLHLKVISPKKRAGRRLLEVLQALADEPKPPAGPGASGP